MSPIVCKGVFGTALEDTDVDFTMSWFQRETAETDTGFELRATETTEGCMYWRDDARVLVQRW